MGSTAKPKPLRRLLTRDQAAAVIGVEPEVVPALVRRGQLEVEASLASGELLFDPVAVLRTAARLRGPLEAA